MMDLPAINASLNALATVLLIVGFVLIKRKRETAHKWTMICCFAVSTLFLVCYLIYHYQIGGGTKFPESHPSWLRYTYFTILISHIILAMYVPVGALITIYHGLKDHRAMHLKWAKRTFPIWLYVSVTGVVIYWMLYQMS
jgi:uncharacterized membrane protein YozB (DUF420 family)